MYKKILLFFLVVWVNIKIFFAKLLKHIHELHLEKTFVAVRIKQDPTMFYLNALGISYKKDKLLFWDWDWQFDTITLFKKKHGDCNSINRVAQMYLYLKNYKSYLVTFIAKDFKKSHTTCIYFKDNYYYSYDYAITKYYSITIKDVIKQVAKDYNTEALCYIVQDVNFKIIAKDIL